VTHDHVEAMGVANVLAVLVDGRIEDAGKPERVYDSPRTLTVARFLGERSMNLFQYGGAIVGIRP
jgi:multiple sugar transport system ATP-binding protein